MTFTSTLEKFDSNLWGHHIVVDEEVAEFFIKAKKKRLICTLNDAISMHCALMPSGDGRYFININKDIRKKLNLHIGSKLKVELKEDDSKYGMAMPEEFEVLLQQDVEGEKFFHALTPGRQRSLIHMVGKFKSSDKRLEKAIVILDFLKWNKGQLDYKALNQAFKDARP